MRGLAQSGLLWRSALTGVIPTQGLHTWLRAGFGYTFNEPTLTAGDPTDLTDAAWTKSAGANVTATNLEFNGTGDGYVEQNPGNTDSGLVGTVILDVSYSDHDWLSISAGSSTTDRIWFNVQNGVVGVIGTGAIRADATDIGGGQIRLRAQLAAGLSTVRIQLVSGDGLTSAPASGRDVNIFSVIYTHGKLSSWTSQDDNNHTFSQATPSDQPFVDPLGTPSQNEQRAVSYSGSQALVSEDVADDWSFLNNGSPSTIFMVYRAGEVASTALNILNSRGGSGNGVQFFFDSTNGHVGFIVVSGSSTVVNDSSAIDSTPTGTLYVGEVIQEEGAATEFQSSTGGVDVDQSAVTYSAGAAGGTLIVGANTIGGSGGFEGEIAEVIIYDRVISALERSQVNAYLQAKFESELGVPNNVLALRADRGITLNGSGVSGWADQGPESNDASQANSSDQPVYSASDSAFAGAPSVTADGVSEWIAVNGASTVISGTDQPFTVVTAQREVSDGGGGDTFWSFGNSASNAGYIRFCRDSGGDYRFQKVDDGGTSANVDSNEDIDSSAHVCSIVHAGVTVSGYVDGTTMSGLDAVSNDVGATTLDQFSLGVLRRIGNANRINAAFSAVAVYSQELNEYQRGVVERALARRTGVTIV